MQTKTHGRRPDPLALIATPHLAQSAEDALAYGGDPETAACRDVQVQRGVCGKIVEVVDGEKDRRQGPRLAKREAAASASSSWRAPTRPAATNGPQTYNRATARNTRHGDRQEQGQSSTFRLRRRVFCRRSP